MELETDRLFLRPLQVEDIVTLTNLWTDPEITLYMGGPSDYKEVYEDLMKETQTEPSLELNLGVVFEKSTRRIIGHSS